MTPPPKKVYQDEWDTGHHEAYEEQPVRQLRKQVSQRKGNSFLRSLGGLLIVASIFWATYILTSGAGPDSLLKFPGPVPLCGAGVVISLLGKFLG